jgi:phospholipid transport system substrate-binding protein
MMSKKLLALALAVPFFVASPDFILTSATMNVAAASEQESAVKLVETLGKEAVVLLSNKDLSESEKRSEFNILINRDFDMAIIGRFVLGKNWRKATDAQKEEYLGLFKRYIVATYQKRIGQYSGENLEIGRAKKLNKKEYLVNSKILRPSGPPIKLDWRVRRSKSGDMKIVDIIVENVSMALTHRDEFASVISRKDGKVEGLIETLNGHIAKVDG